MLDLVYFAVKYPTHNGTDKGSLEVLGALVRSEHTVGADENAVETSHIKDTGVHEKRRDDSAVRLPGNKVKKD